MNRERRTELGHRDSSWLAPSRVAIADFGPHRGATSKPPWHASRTVDRKSEDVRKGYKVLQIGAGSDPSRPEWATCCGVVVVRPHVGCNPDLSTQPHATASPRVHPDATGFAY